VSATAPGPRTLSPLGSLGAWRRDPLDFLDRCFREHGDVVRFRFGPLAGVLLAHPDHVERVLVTHHRDYTKQTRGWRKMREFLGEGLITSEGSHWLRQRRIAQPAFHRQRIASFAGLMTRACVEELERWEPAARDGRPLDVAQAMMRLTLRIVGETLLSADVTGEADAVGRALAVVLHESIERMSNPLADLPLPTPGNRRYKAAMAELDGVILGMIAERRRTGEDRGDLLSMLMLAVDEETGERMDDRQLRDEAMAIFLAGHETTANALSWTFHALSLSPAAERRLREEVGALGGRVPGLDDLPRLPYALAVVKEAMRLYPPVWVVSRHAERADAVGGFAVPRGAIVLVSPYVTHKHPAFWREPEAFRPERFLDGEADRQPRFAYFPFGGGPRQCIGNGFALMEAQLLLATIVQRYRLERLPERPVLAEPTITLRPKDGLPFRVARA
jgi:cytochrome P450